jgi:signal transduction histidine kinase
MRLALLLTLLLLITFSPIAIATPQNVLSQSPEFTYQGHLEWNGNPFHGTVDLVFSLWDAEVGGNSIATPISKPDYPVVGGLFSVSLAFPDAFTGEQRFLESSINGEVMLIADTVAQVGELTRLVGDLVELARGDGEEEAFTLVDLLDLTRRVVATAERHHPSMTFHLDGTRSVVRGAPARISRALSNLIDNAAKWSPAGGAVHITVRDGAVTVRDHGPGIDPGDLPHLFDRFYRSSRARTMPGSGLGLAIVKQVADSHHATVTATTATEGGALFTLRFPLVGDEAATVASHS